MCDLLGAIKDGRLVTVDTPARIKVRAGGDSAPITVGAVSNAALTDIQKLPSVSAVRVQGDELRIVLERGASLPPVVRMLVEHGVKSECSAC